MFNMRLIDRLFPVKMQNFQDIPSEFNTSSDSEKVVEN